LFYYILFGRIFLATMLKSLFFLGFLSGTFAKTVHYDWDITWVWANPDGLQPRSVIGINGKFPCPAIEADLGDTIEVKVNNKLGNETTGLHFHGQTQMGTNHMDGPSGVTQCPSRSNFTCLIVTVKIDRSFSSPWIIIHV
jgi:iron transport multicopper oxidase